MAIDLITDHKWKQFKYGYEVPKTVLKDYDHLDEDDTLDRWIQYRRNWYHISDFLSCHNQIHNPDTIWLRFGYDGYLSDSFFSGVLIKLSDDNEEYQIATYMS